MLEKFVEQHCSTMLDLGWIDVAVLRAQVSQYVRSDFKVNYGRRWWRLGQKW